jgi:DUF4097 and DUF4098 domain-containing protein YvlB
MRMLLSLVPMAALISTGCVDFADFGDSHQYKEDFHYSYPLSNGGTLALENTNGSVEISGWEQNTVEVNGTKYASTQHLLDGVKVDTSVSSGSVRIRTTRPFESRGGAGAEYRIRVPRKVLLDTIATTNGPIRVEDLEGNVRLRSTNGSIRTHKVHGEVTAHTTNGNLEALEVDGNTMLETNNGNIQTEMSHGSLEARTTNGSINAAVADAASNWPVRLHSTNGRIELKVRGATIPDVRADTSNSSVTLELPRGANARVKAHTSNSAITSDFEISAQGGTHSKHDLEGSIGSGGPLLDLSSRNGAIKILRF